MVKRVVLLATIIATMLTLVAGPATSAPPGSSGQDGYEIRIVGNARLAAFNGQIDGTTVALQVRVRCPAGAAGGYVPFAGMPDAFGGTFAAPYLPGHTSPATYGGMFTCTGTWERVTTLARSVARNQDPATHPFEYFSHGRTRFVVEIAADGEPKATHTRTVQVVAPGFVRR
jgi:hypothetical protein